MRLIHISDLHLGLQYGEFSLYEDQAFILNQIIEKISALKADVLLISGDIYHKYAPAAESFKLWSKFLSDLEPLKIHTYIIAGNHDAADRLGVGAHYLKYGHIHLVSEYQGALETFLLEHQDVRVKFCLLPFVRPSSIKNKHDDFDSNRYNDAIEYVLKGYDYDKASKHVLLAHQFVIDGKHIPSLSDSEIPPQVGGLDAISVQLFNQFDYVALGHIHRPQRIGSETIRYSGSPLKYSKTESLDTKGLVVVDVGDDVTISIEPLEPMRDVRVMKGNLEDLINAGKDSTSQDFIHAVLTDKVRPINAMEKLQVIYPNCVDIEFESEIKSTTQESLRAEEIIQLKPFDLMSQFYQEFLEKPLDDEAQIITENVINQVLEGQDETH